MSEHRSTNESDESLFVAALAQAQSALHAFLISMLPGQPEVEDILQRANTVLWKKREEYDPSGSFDSWALAVAYWEARAWMTERKRENWLLIDEDLVESIIENLVAEPKGPPNADVEALQTCLGRLRDKDRLLFLSHHQHGKSLRECGQVFERPPESLKVSLFRIRAALRRCITSQLALEQVQS